MKQTFRCHQDYIMMFKVEDTNLKEILIDNIATMHTSYVNYLLHKFPYSLFGMYDLEYTFKK